MKRIIKTDQAPSSKLYSQAIEANGFLYLSGQLPINPSTGKFVSYDIKGQTEQVFRNISAILAEAGYQLSDIIKTTVFMSDMDLFANMNEVYATQFSGIYPARSTFAVKDLPMGALIEIEAVASK